jgi:TRAP-type transport system periplasmic protein
MKRVWNLGWIGVAAAVVLISACVVVAAEKPVELTYSIFFPAPHKMTVLATDWAKEIESRTNGKVRITIFPGGTLTQPDKCYDGVAKGISDLGMSALAYTRGKFPLSEAIDLPLGYRSGVSATRLINDFFLKFSPREFSEIKIMYFHAHGPGLLHSKKPVQRLEDLKGMKIRSTGLSSKVVGALGGIPVAMPMGETYDALSRGLAEGSMAPIESLQGWKWGEVVKASTESFGSAYTTGFFVAMNKDKWSSLSSDAQKTIEKVNEEWIGKTGKLWDEIDKAGKEFSLKLGNQVISLPKEENERWAATVKPILAEYVKNMQGKNLPGEEVLKFCQDRLKKLQ